MTASIWKAAVIFAQSTFQEPLRWTWNRGESLTWEHRVAGGPARDETADLLVDRLFGMPECTVERIDATYSIVDHPGHGELTAALRSTTMPAQPESDELLARLSAGSKVNAGWQIY